MGSYQNSKVMHAQEAQQTVIRTRPTSAPEGNHGHKRHNALAGERVQHTRVLADTLARTISQESSALATPESVREASSVGDEFVPRLVIHESASESHIPRMVPQGRRAFIVILCLLRSFLCVLI